MTLTTRPPSVTVTWRTPCVDISRAGASMRPRSREQGLALGFRRGEGKPRRPPGALPKSGDAVPGEALEHRCDARADKGSALYREKSAPSPSPNSPPHREGLEVLGGKRGNAACRCVRWIVPVGESGQRGEGLDLVRAMHAGLARIEDERRRTPCGGKGTRQRHLRQRAVARTAVEHRAALLGARRCRCLTACPARAVRRSR